MRPLVSTAFLALFFEGGGLFPKPTPFLCSYFLFYSTYFLRFSSPQAALLYTTSSGERRIRVHNVAIPVETVIQNVFDSVNIDVMCNILAKQALEVRVYPREISNNGRLDDAVRIFGRCNVTERFLNCAEAIGGPGTRGTQGTGGLRRGGRESVSPWSCLMIIKGFCDNYR